MTNLQLLEAIGMIDEKTIQDAEQKSAVILTAPRRRLARQLAAAAACVCLLFGGAVAAQLGGWGGAKSGDPGSTDEVTQSTLAGIGTGAAATTTAAMTHPATVATTAGNITTPPPQSQQAAITTTMPATHTSHANTETYLTTTTAWVTSAAMTTTETGNPMITIPEEGLTVYRETFDRCANTEDSTAVMTAVRMSRMTMASDGVYNETNAAFALREGRLYFNNITPEGSGKDGYYCLDVLRDSDLTRTMIMGKYTLQYDLEYVGAGNAKRYATIITELSESGQCYNTFHLRVNGIAYHQCHFYGSWKTYSAYDPAIDLNPTADDPTGAEGTPLIRKLLGLDIAECADQLNLLHVKVTVRLQWDPEMGHHVYLKTAEMTDFIKVSEPSVNAEGPMYIGWEGWFMALKLGGAIEGYLDNIHLWTGWGEEPQG